MNKEILKMEKICKTFSGVVALKDVDFSVNEGEIRCLIGANGAGKSTLMKVLSGAYQKTSGKIFFNNIEIDKADPKAIRDLGIAIIYQELSIIDSLTVAENIFLNNSKYFKRNSIIKWNEINKDASELLKSYDIEIEPTTLVKNLSIGHKQLIEIIKAIATDAKLIVMDEPSATLSKKEYKTLLSIINKLHANKITIIFISHRLEELYEIGETVSVLKNGEHVFTGSLKTLDINSLVKYMIGKTVVNERKILNQDYVNNKKIIELKNINTNKLKNLSLDIKKGEIRGIYGLVGSGRSEILHAIYGVDKIISGDIIKNNKAITHQKPHQAIKEGIGLLPEDRKTKGIIVDLPVWENIIMVAIKKFSKNHFLNYKKINIESNNYISQLQIKTPNKETLVKNLSGGNQQKVVIAKWLIEDCEILLVDEPTQGIDVGVKAEIYDILRDLSVKGKTIIIVSSELDELISVSNNISVMYEGKLVKTFTTNEIDSNAIQECAITGRIK